MFPPLFYLSISNNNLKSYTIFYFFMNFLNKKVTSTLIYEKRSYFLTQNILKYFFVLCLPKKGVYKNEK